MAEDQKYRCWRRAVSAFIAAIVVALSIPAITMSAPAIGGRLLSVREIDRSQYPWITLRLGLTTVLRSADFKVRENGRPIKDLKVDFNVDKQPVAVTLLMDISGSMKGKPLEDAKAAAKLFIARTHENDRIALVAFNSTVDRLVDFTNDKARLNQAIEKLDARGETAVYDALLNSLNAAALEKLPNKSMILLSDGADTASRAGSEEPAALAETLRIPVSAIALQSSAFNPGPIELIAKRSNGRLLTAYSSPALTSMYDGLAAELHNRFRLRFKSHARTATSKIEIEALVGAERLKTTTVLTGLPAVNQPTRKAAAKRIAPNWSIVDRIAFPWVAGIVGFLAVFLLVVGLAGVLLPGQNILAEQLTYYDQLRGRAKPDDKKAFLAHGGASLVDIVKRISTRYDFTTYAQAKLEQAGLPVKPHEYITMHLAVVVGLSFMAFFFSGNLFLIVTIISVIIVGPLAGIQIAIDRRRALFADQLPDTLDTFAGSMKAGYGLQQAIVAAARDARPPTAGELTRVANQTQMGMPLEDALDRMAERIGDTSFKWVVLAIAIHRETGGNLTEILNNLAASLRQRQTMGRQIKALTAEGRMSMVVLMVLPFVEVGLLSIVNPKYLSVLVTTKPGLTMLAGAAILMFIGAIWMRAIARIDY